MILVKIIKHFFKLVTRKEELKFIPRSTKKDQNFDIFNFQVFKYTNESEYKTLIGIDGIGFSGSSAVTDFLAEFQNCTVLGGVDLRENPERGIENTYEIDFFRDPYGILELEKICYNNVTRIRNHAIKDFISLVLQNQKNNSYFYNKYYINETKIFLDKIIDYIIPLPNNDSIYVPKKLTLEEYRDLAKNYITSFLKSIKSKENLVLDNLMSIGEDNKIIFNSYFGNYKLIYVYSDPRDIYARARLQPGNDWVPSDPQLFCKFYLREFPSYFNSNNPSLLCISFDEFCNKYNMTSKKIMDFLNLKSEDHIYKFKFFNPNISINNTRVYKKLENQEPIKYIYEQLKEYCYD